MWHLFKKFIRPSTAIMLGLSLFLSGFPSSYLIEKITEHNIIDSLYWAGKDSNVKDKSIAELFAPKVETAQAANFTMQTGYYIGNGGTLSVTGLGFQPQFIIIKSDTTAGQGVWKTSAMPAADTAFFPATANNTTSLISLDADGFTVGTNANMNNANVRYVWIAFAGSDCTASGTFCVGTYTGNGTSPRALTVTGFTPSFVMVKRSTAVGANFRTTSMGASVGNYFTTTAQNGTGALFTTLDATGFTVGATNNVNTGVYYYVAFAATAGIMAEGTYAGNATDNTNITGFGSGAVPNFVFTKNVTNATAANRSVYFNITQSFGDYSSRTDAATADAVNIIQALQNDGFQIGSSAISNGSGDTIYWVGFGGAPAIPSGSGTFTMANGTYTGNTTGQSISGVGFAPDLVMIKDGAANYQAFRTKLMKGDNTAYFSNAAANFTTGITSLDSDGFTVGSSAVVNTLGNTYQWTAFGNAFNPETRTGAADFAIGAYQGNGIDNRNATDTPFLPDLVATKRNGATAGAWRSSALSGDTSSFFGATAETANNIQTLYTNGFQIGTTNNVNTATSPNLYHWFAFKTGPNFTVGTYTGSGGAQNITTVGFQPDLLWVKRSTAVNGVSRPSSLAGDATQYFANLANVATRIVTFISNGFSLSGASTETNANTATYRFAAWQGKQYTQSAYRWFVNANSTDVGSPLAAQDAPATVNFTGTTTRLRMLIHVDNGTLFTSGQNFKLQFTTSTGACDTGFSGETYQDVTTSTLLAYNNNAAPADGATLTANGSDPTHGGDTIVPQTYEEANNFTNSANPIPKSQDGKWDFALIDNGAPANTTYCLRAVKSDGTLLDTYSVIPQITTATVPVYTQNYFRVYTDNDALLPTDPWPAGAVDLGENAAVTSADNPIANGENMRLRMSVQVSATGTLALEQTFRLQYGTLVTTCGAIGSWTDIGAPGSGSIWRGVAGTPLDGAALSGNPPTGGDLKLSVADRAGTYEESNDTAANPFALAVGEDVEYDWNIENNGAAGATNYCFRMARGGGGSALNSYNFYPVIRTAGFRPKSQNWRWYDDETNETPLTSLAAENIAPANIENDNLLKLRVAIKETANVAGTNTKLGLQFSQSSDFSSGVFSVDATSTCNGSSSWCYADGVDTDNDGITTKLLSDADACSGGVGNGCGTHNEASTTPSTFTHAALAATEYEFTIKRSGGSPNTVYYFRAYDKVNDVPVPFNTGESYPSLVTKGGLLTFSVDGISSGTSIEGITTDITTTATSIPFGTLSFGSEVEGAHRLTITTDASQGYQIFLRQENGFLSNNGAEIFGVTGTNASPSAWATGCLVSAAGCYGYHAGDDTLAGGSSRFLSNDTYAKLENTSKEVAFSSVSVTDEITDIVFKAQITNQQAAGTYDSTLMYIVVPVF